MAINKQQRAVIRLVRDELKTCAALDSVKKVVTTLGPLSPQLLHLAQKLTDVLEEEP